jgi:putative ABC transport system substrate-binding protein
VKRRAFISLLGGAAAAWPLAARGQQAMPVVGFLNPASLEAVADRVRGFRVGLNDTGYLEGEGVAVEYRWGNGRFDRMPALASELVQRKVAVIAATGGAASALAAKGASATIPVVFSLAQDPVGLGLVASLARPGGNATGINFFSGELVTKRLQLLRELIPGAARVAVLVNPTNTVNTDTTLKDVQAAAGPVGLQIRVFGASTISEINAAFATIVRERLDAVFVGQDGFFNSRRVQLTNLASRYALPATYGGRDFTVAGGLMSYGSDITDAYRQVGIYVGRILKGAKPADLPVVQASRFELIINTQAAQLLGLTVPPTLLSVADEVIE